MNYTLIGHEDAPLEIKNWLEENITVEGNKIITIKDSTYVVITRGEKKTGGFGIEIDCIEKDNLIEILVKFINPNQKKDQIVIQVISFPLLIIKFKKTNKDITIIYENK